MLTNIYDKQSHAILVLRLTISHKLVTIHHFSHLSQFTSRDLVIRHLCGRADPSAPLPGGARGTSRPSARPIQSA